MRVPVLVYSTNRITRRQVSRALVSGGMEVRFNGDEAAAQKPPALLIIDADTTPREQVVQVLQSVSEQKSRPPVVLLSVGEDKTPLLDLVKSFEIGNLVAKHGAIRAVHPVVDERELLVTCQKVLTRQVFGLEKYVGSWGVLVHRHTVKALSQKTDVLGELETFLRELDIPASVVPDILTVAEELLLNAIVHAPRTLDGTPKYEHLGPTADIQLEPNEYVEIAWSCDSQRLMLSVTDNFGALNRNTLLGYVAKGLGGQVEVEGKASGAGLGLSMSFLSIHQLIFNIAERTRTEAIAGWYLRVNTAAEFRQVAKSLNVFYLGHDAAQVQSVVPQPAAAAPRTATPSSSGIVQAGRLQGRIDENSQLGALRRTQKLDLSKVTGFTSRGVQNWVRFLDSLPNDIDVYGCPDVLVRLMADVKGMSKHLVIKTVLAPYDCQKCLSETTEELSPERLLSGAAQPRPCPSCGAAQVFSGDEASYRALPR